MNALNKSLFLLLSIVVLQTVSAMELSNKKQKPVLNNEYQLKLKIQLFTLLRQKNVIAIELQQLIDAGVDINDSYGAYTPLVKAAYKGHIAIAQLLINAGAKLDALNREFVFLMTRNTVTIKKTQRLIDAGADVNARDKDNYTALLYAAELGLTAIAQCLIDNGAQVNVQAVRTPLMLAAQCGHADTVQLLLNNGANLNLQTYMDNTALIIANEHPLTVHIIIKHVLFTPKTNAKTLMLCLNRLAQTNASARELCRQGKTLLKPHVLYALAQENKEKLRQFLTHRNRYQKRAYDYNTQLDMLNPDNIDETIRQFVQEEMQEQEAPTTDNNNNE